MSSPLEKGRAKGAGWICPAGASFYVAENVLLAGIVSHVWHEILRLSPHLFWLVFFSHRAFSFAQDDDTGERIGSQGWCADFLEDGNLVSQPSPLGEGLYGSGFAAFFIGRCSKVVFKSPVTSHSYDTREGIVLHVWCQILRLSSHLFWLGLFIHRAFSSAQDDDTVGSGWDLIWEIRCMFWN